MERHRADWNKLHSPATDPKNVHPDLSHNDVLSNRAAARRLWRALERAHDLHRIG